MLFPILQALWQQAGPQVTQFINSPAFAELVRALQRVPLPIYAQVGRALSTSVTSWYNSLSYQDQKRMQDAIAWVIKDLSGDVIAAATGLPIGSLVNLGVAKVLDDLDHHNPPPEEVSFIQSELLRQMNTW
jgi:hypothetical protein